MKENATELGLTEDELGELLGQADEAGEELDGPSWQKRLREVVRQRGLEAAEIRKQKTAEPNARRIEKGIDQATEIAVERYDFKEQRREGSQRTREFFSNVFSAESVGQVFVYFSAFAVANLTAFGILSWTQTKLQKYPEMRAAGSASQVFPVLTYWRRSGAPIVPRKRNDLAAISRWRTERDQSEGASRSR